MVLLAAAACGKSAGSGAAGNPDRDEFARRFMTELRAQGAPSSRYDQADFAVEVGGDGGAVRVYLSNFYAEYLAAPAAERPAALRRMASLSSRPMPAPPDDYARARPLLLPVVREGTYIEAARLDGEARGQEVPAIPAERLGDFLLVAVAVDSDESLAIVNAKALADWGVGYPEARRAAEENLRARSREPFLEVSPGLWMSPWQDVYDSSRLLLPELARALPLRGRPIAMVPNRSVLLLAGEEDAAALLAMAELAEKTLAEPRPMSGVALVLDGDAWRTHLPAPTAEVERRFRRLAVDSMGALYADQGELLERVHERRGEDRHVGSFIVVDRPGGVRVSYSVWSKGADGLLPRTDYVGFYDGDLDKAVAFDTWDHVTAIAGARMEPVGMTPERWRVRSFPSADELSRLAKEPAW